MITSPAKVPEKKISSSDISKFDGGWFMNGAQNAPRNAFTKSKDVALDPDGYIIPRPKLAKLLPQTVGTAHQKLPVLWDNQIYHFTADDGKIRYCLKTDTDWTDCGGTNSFTLNNGGICKLERVLNKILIINGKNGDRLAYVDLETAGFPVVKYTKIDDPTSAPTGSPKGGLSGSGDYKIYYAISYTSTIGETKLSPALTQTISDTRELWPGLSDPGSLEITRVGTAPSGATYWNLYVALAASSGSITDDDFMLLASKLDLDVDKFTDNGTLPIQLESVAPVENSTEGPMVDQAIIANGRPILFDDQINPYNIWIGGGGQHAMDFTINNGGYRAEPEKGTNYYPTTIVGFRNGPGQPALTVLYSSPEGLSKQAVLEQQTITYGDFSFTVWGVTEQYYGAAGVAAPNSAVNYKGRLIFLSTDGFMSMETEINLQNVLSTKEISSPIDPYVRSIKTSAMQKVVGAGWNNKYLWTIPSYGFDEPQQIVVLDTNSKGIEGNGAWYTYNIKADWVGVISPPDEPAFVYVSQGRNTYKFIELKSTFDRLGSKNQGFSTECEGPLMPLAGEAHNQWQASVQAMFYITELAGEITVGVRYKNQDGEINFSEFTQQGPVAAPSIAGGWGDPNWAYAHFPQVLGWGSAPPIGEDDTNRELVDIRIPVPVDDIINEAQWYFRTPIGYNNFKLRAFSQQGVGLGVRPDLQ